MRFQNIADSVPGHFQTKQAVAGHFVIRLEVFAPFQSRINGIDFIVGRFIKDDMLICAVNLFKGLKNRLIQNIDVVTQNNDRAGSINRLLTESILQRPLYEHYSMGK